MADCVPVGYRFLPSDEELLLHYLGNKVAGRPLTSGAVSDADVYGTEPWVLLCGRHEAYFFAERKRKNATGSRVDRSAGSGSWTLYGKEDVVTSIVGGRKVVVGRKSSLSFNDGRRKNSGWTMHEYELASASDKFQTQVLCHLACTGKGRNQQPHQLSLKRKSGGASHREHIFSPPASSGLCTEIDGIFSPSTSSDLSAEIDCIIDYWVDSARQVFLLPVSSPGICDASAAVSPSLPTEITLDQICLDATFMEQAGHEEPIFFSPTSNSVSRETYHASEEATYAAGDLVLHELPDDLILFNAQDLLSEETLSLLK